MFDAIQEQLSSGEKVQIIGFGTFEVRERASRKRTQPQTGEEIEIPATKVPASQTGQRIERCSKTNKN